MESKSNFNAIYPVETGISKIKKRKAEEEYWASLAGPVTIRKIDQNPIDTQE